MPRVFAMLLALFGAFGAQAEENQPIDNLLSLSRGGVMLSASADPLRALALIDGDPASNWNVSTKKAPPPHQFVLEMIATAQLDAVGIHGAGARPGGVQNGSAGPVIVEGSAIGPETGYTEIARFMADPEGVTLAPVSATGPQRWLRFTVMGAQQPDVDWLYLTEVMATGTMTPPQNTDRFTGVFQIGRKDFLELAQDGTTLSGCFVENSGRSVGTLTGAVVEGVGLLDWVNDQGITGTAVLTRDNTGALSGVRYRQRSRSVWAGPVAPQGTVTPCSNVPPTPDPIVAGLQRDGVVRIYGILFNHDSDVPRSVSLPALERLLTALQGAPELSVMIEGHTDADGADSYNLDLSARRAEAVVGWLTERGIAPDRLQPLGKGEAEPIASNATADGKTLNRRVQVRLR